MSGKRRSYRPTVVEALEERLVLSHPGGHVVAAVVQAAALTASSAPNVHNTPVALGPVGALGDSYTDEYEFYPPDRSTARNWVEILHALRGVSFGPFTTASRGEPRDQGYAYNWARSDATSTDMINNQLPGLTAQVAAGDIRYAWVFIGGNDFLHLGQALAGGQISPVNAIPAILATEAQLEVNFTRATQTLLAASPDVKLVVATLPDINTVPIARVLAASNPLAGLALQFIGGVIQKYDGLIRATAASNPRIALVDLDAVTKAVAALGSPTLNFGVPINLLTPGNDYHNFFLADFYHIGTLGQTLVADLFASAIDFKFGAGLFPVSPQEAAAFAKGVYEHATRPVAVH
jgi:hypothetical protein